MATIHRVLVICTGNICRSPMAQRLLQSRADNARLSITVTSAGTHALVGREPDRNAQAVMSELGHDISQLRATQCDSEGLLAADLVLAMDHLHLGWAHKYFPHVRGRVMLMGKWSGDSEVPDPYGYEMDRFRLVRNQLDEYSDLWCDWLSRITRQG